MPGTGTGPGDSPADRSGDINSRLGEIAAELTASARFTEPSAAERMSVPVKPVAAATSRGGPRRLRDRRLAAELRKPVQAAMPGGAPGPRWPGRGRAAASTARASLGRLAQRRRVRHGRPQPVPDRGYAMSSMRSPHRSLAILLVAMVILIALCGLVVAFMNRP